MTVAVPRLGWVLLPYPPQPAIAILIPTMMIAIVAAASKGRSLRSFPLVHIAKLHIPKANRSAYGPIVSNVGIAP